MWLASAAFVAVYVARGWQLAGLGRRGAQAIAWAPLYLVWKVAVLLRSASEARFAWVRTAREEPRS
jgi:predicted acetyltransferase